jgi:predicted PurR-regulated permease PerM
VYSSTLPLPSDLRWRRLIVVALFLGLLYFFRSLAPVFICFVILERSLGWAADQIDKRTPLHRTGSIATLLTVLTGLVGLAVFMAIRRALPLIQHVRAHGTEYLRAIFDHPSIEQLRAMAGIENDSLSKVFKEHGGTALKYATSTAHLILFLLIGGVLAVIYLFERDDIERWLGSMDRNSVPGTLARWFGYVGDAIAVTVRMQIVVAVVNAVVTLPVLLFLRLPHIPMLFVLILVSGLLPVVGNFISGAVLCYVAYTARGWWAVGVFLGVTFLLGKIGGYYLNPRLASQHVKLPSLVLVVSLLLFEVAFGFVGLFLSFPALFVASRIVNEWREQKAAADAVAIAESTPTPELAPVAEAAEPGTLDELVGVEPEAPVEEAPAEEAPAEEAPAEQAPAEEAPAEQAPAEEAPAEQAALQTGDAHLERGARVSPDE